MKAVIYARYSSDNQREESIEGQIHECTAFAEKNDITATEVISSGADGILLKSVLEGFAEYYSADLAEKVTRGLTENALKGKCNGGTRPVGYVVDDKQHFQIDPLTGPFVQEAFKRYADGATMKELVEFFKGKGIKNSLGRDMNLNSVQRMLSNRRYMGEYAFRDIVVPDGIPAIIPKELFDRVQAKLTKNKKSPARHKAEEDYLLTTKLFCGCCGAYMCGDSGKGRSGEVHRYYKCVSIKKRRAICNKKSVRKDWIEDIVVNATMKMLMSDTTIDAIVSALMTLQDAENVNLPLYEKQLKETNVAINNLLNAIQAGILNRSTKERFDQLEAARDELENKIAAEKLAKPRITEEQLRFFLDRFRKLDVRQLSHRRMLIDTFINAVFLYDDKLVLTYNFREGTETITFDDLKNKLGEGFSGSDMSSVAAPKQGFQFLLESFNFSLYYKEKSTRKFDNLFKQIIIVFSEIMPRIMTRNYTCAPRISCASKKANSNILSDDLVRFLYSEPLLRQLRFLRHWPRQRAIHRVTRFPPDPSRGCRDAPPGWKRRSACAFCRTDAVG